MGVAQNVGATNFPKQGPHLDKQVEVCFNYDTSRTFPGKIVRDDYEDPWVTIIELGDGRYLLSTECMYSTG